MKKQLAILLFLVVSPLICTSREWKAGLLSSPDGYGISSDWAKSGDRFFSLSAYVDCYDRMFGNGGQLGICFNFSHNLIFKRWQTDGLSTFLYAGPGVTAGYLRDRGDALAGPTLAVTGTFGARFVFSRGIAVDLSLDAAAGFHLDIHDNNTPAVLDLYKRGLTHIPFPKVKILFPLR